MTALFSNDDTVSEGGGKRGVRTLEMPFLPLTPALSPKGRGVENFDNTGKMQKGA